MGFGFLGSAAVGFSLLDLGSFAGFVNSRVCWVASSSIFREQGSNSRAQGLRAYDVPRSPKSHKQKKTGRVKTEL